MNELTEETYAVFTKRFGDLHDALISSIEIIYQWEGSEAHTRKAQIELQAYDISTAATKGLPFESLKLKLILDGVQELNLNYTKESHPLEIISDTCFVWESNTVFVDFEPGDCSVDSIRGSRLYFVCKSVYWKVLE